MRSEVEFIEEVISSIHNPQSKLKNFDECRFSRIEAVTDDVYIPYYDATSIAKSSAGKISHFFPDFIFWLKKGKKQFIVFIDPKGTENYSWTRKVRGFEDYLKNKPMTKNVTVKMFLYTDEIAKINTADREYWYDDFEKCLEKCT